MGRSPKAIDPAAPGRVLAEHLRTVIARLGLTHAQVARAAHLSESTISSTLGGKLPGWPTVNSVLIAIEAAAKAEGWGRELPGDLYDTARAIWRDAKNDATQPAAEAPATAPATRMARAAGEQQVLLAAMERLVFELPPPLDPTDPHPLATLRAALNSMVNRRGINPQDHKFGDVDVTAELVRDVLAGKWSLTRDLVGAIVAATGANPKPWVEVYLAANTATRQNASRQPAAEPAARGVAAVPHLRAVSGTDHGYPAWNLDAHYGYPTAEHAAVAEVVNIGRPRPRSRFRAS